MTIHLMMGNEAIGTGAVHAGVNFVSGYPGTPSTEVLETVAKLNDGSIHVEWSTNEKAALEAAIGASWSGARALVTMKQVGLNVASDPLMTLSYQGVKGGLVLVVADDPGPISSQTEQDTRTFGAFSKVPVLDPVSSGECYGMVQDAFEMSERYDTPVILRPTTRVSHSCGTVKTRGGIADCAPPEVFKHAGIDENDGYWKQFQREPEGFVKDTQRWVVFPRTSFANHARAEERAVQIACDYSRGYHPNRIEMGAQHHHKGAEAFAMRRAGTTFPLGVACGGISYHYVKEVLEEEGLDLPVFKVATPYPFPAPLAAEFLGAVDEVVVVEELDPVIERELTLLAGRMKLRRTIRGKLDGTFGYAGEQSVEAIREVLLSAAGVAGGTAVHSSLLGRDFSLESAGADAVSGAGQSADATYAGGQEPAPTQRTNAAGSATASPELAGSMGSRADTAASAARSGSVVGGVDFSLDDDGDAGNVPLECTTCDSGGDAVDFGMFPAPNIVSGVGIDDGEPAEAPGSGDAAAGEPAKPEVPARPPVLCAGCPHRASFYAVKRAMRGKKAVFCGDIGCYTLGNAAPLDMVDTCVCMGADITVAQGISTVDADATAFSFIGDSTFFASGITGAINAVYNQHEQVICVLDNSTTAMTGHQPHPGTGRTMMGVDGSAMSIPAILDALGVDNVTVDPLDLDAAVQAVKDAAAKPGVKAVIFKSPCIYTAKQSSPALQVDQDACIKCHACIDQVGCPAIALVGGEVQVNAGLCYGCNLCAQLCPRGALVAEGGQEPSPTGQSTLVQATETPEPVHAEGVDTPTPGSFEGSLTPSVPPGSGASLNCVICGVGGQGNVLASRLVADVLLQRNEHVKTAETIGMAQRGGSVASHVRGGRPQSPLVPKGKANVIIAFEPGEAVRCIDFAAPGCTVVVNTRAVQPPTAALSRSSYDGSEALAYLRSRDDIELVEVDGDAYCREVGSPKVLNIVLLAAAVRSGALGMSREEFEQAVRGRVKERFHAMNLHAVELVFGE